MIKRIFIWVAHPKAGSLSAGLADAYQAGAERLGAHIRRMDLSDMTFDMNFDGYGDGMPPLEPDLVQWQENLAWADHVLVVHPYWWGALPGKAMALLDRALLPGFAYRYRPDGKGWDKLLAGRTADVIVTSDTPPLIDTFIYGRPGRRVMKNQVLGFCGLRTKKVVQFGPVTKAEPEKISRWIGQAADMGGRAAA